MKQEMKTKVTPEILARIFSDTEIIYVANYNKIVKILTHFENGTLFYEKLKDKYKLIYG